MHLYVHLDVVKFISNTTDSAQTARLLKIVMTVDLAMDNIIVENWTLLSTLMCYLHLIK